MKSYLVFGLPHWFPCCFFGLPGCCEDAGQYWELTLAALEPPVENGVPPVVPAIAATPASSRAAASAGLARRDLAILPRFRAVGTDPAARFIASSFMRSSSRGVASARSWCRRAAMSCRSSGSRWSSRGAINVLYERQAGFLTGQVER